MNQLATTALDAFFASLQSRWRDWSLVLKKKRCKMAIIKNLIPCDNKPKGKTSVVADYCYDNNYFQIRTYREGDQNKSENSKQNIEIDKKWRGQ